MAIDQTNWSQFLKPDSELAPDITFHILEEQPGGAEGDDSECKTSKVQAHKFLLAGVSSVFRKQFFGPLKTTEDTVDIKDTTIEAFTTMISFIYQPSDSDSFSLSTITCPQELCELLNLAERYEMLTMGALVRSILESHPITSENMIFTATVAKNFAVFENVSKMLLAKCGQFCTSKLKTSDDVFTFLKDTQDNFPEHDTGLLLEVLRCAAKCRNCLEIGGKCKDGEDVTGLENPGVLRAGLVVARKDPGENTVCSFSCQADFLFPMPEGIGQAEVVSLTKGQSQGTNSFGGAVQLQQPVQFHIGGPVAAPRPGPFQGSFVLRCIGHNKQLASENMTAADGKANFVFSCGKSVRKQATPTFQGLEEFKNLQVSPGSSAQRARVFARRSATARRTKNPT